MGQGAAGWCGLGPDIRKHLGHHANHGGDLGHVGNPDRAELFAKEQQKTGQPIQHPGQVFRPLARVHHDQTQMQHFGWAWVGGDLHQGQRVKGDGGAVLAGDQRDNGIAQAGCIARKHAVGQASGSQCFRRDPAQVSGQLRQCRLLHPQSGAFDNPHPQVWARAQGQVQIGLRQTSDRRTNHAPASNWLGPLTLDLPRSDEQGKDSRPRPRPLDRESVTNWSGNRGAGQIAAP